MTDWHLQLRKKVRTTNGQNYTLFARISPEIARTFFRHLSALSLSQEFPSSVTGYNFLDHLESGDTITFLPLEISFSDKTKIYVSYNGGSIDEGDAIELPSSALPNNCVDAFVSVCPVLFVPDARELTVEPVSTEDWELFEMHSSYFENGALLKQVSLVFPDQVLSLSFGDGYDFARVRVDPRLEGCHRLVEETEFVVVPKPRPKQPAPSERFLLLGTTEEWSDSMINFASQWGINLITVSPRSMLINPKTLAEVQGYTDTMTHAVVWRDDVDVMDRAVSLVKIETNTEIQQGCIALCIMNRFAINAIPLVHHVRIQLISSKNISRGIKWTKELMIHKEFQISLSKLESVAEEEIPYKPWRDCEYWSSRFCSNLAKVSTRKDNDEILVTDGSIVVHPRIGCLCKVRIKVCEVEDRDERDFSPVPQVIIAVQEIQELDIVGTYCKSLDKYEMQLSLMPPTPHVARDYDNTVIDCLRVEWDSYDAWIVEGDPGSGRTHLCLLLAAFARMKLAMPTFYLDCKSLQAGSDLKMQSMLHELTATFAEAFTFKPSILILDNLDHIVPNLHSDSMEDNPVASDQAKLIANHIQYLMETCESKVIFLISCKALSSIHSELLESIACYKSLTIGALNASERSKLLRAMIRKDYKVSVENLSSLSEGYRVQDLNILVSRAGEALKRDKGCISTVFADIIGDYVPLSRQGLKISSGISESQEWKDVGGLFDAKQILKSTVLDPVKYRRIYQKAPVQLPNGILLFGPPGCGKSFLVPALARECGIHSLITCRGPELLDRYIGASESNVRQLFEQARSAAPSILFLDEFDALAPRRGTDHTGVTDRVVNQLLTFLDGVESTMEGVFIIAATSRPDKVDPALLRPGRLEQHIYIGFPKSPVELNDVITKMLANRILALDLAQAIESKAFCSSHEEASHLQLLSAADIQAALDTAHIAAIHDHIEEGYSGGSRVVIHLHHFRKALSLTRPSLSPHDSAMFNTINRRFLSSCQPGDKSTIRTHVEQKTSLK